MTEDDSENNADRSPHVMSVNKYIYAFSFITSRPVVRTHARCLGLLLLLLWLLLWLHWGQAPFPLYGELEVFRQRLSTAQDLISQDLGSKLLKLDRAKCRRSPSLMTHGSTGFHRHHRTWLGGRHVGWCGSPTTSWQGTRCMFMDTHGRWVGRHVSYKRKDKTNENQYIFNIQAPLKLVSTRKLVYKWSYASVFMNN